MKYVKEDFTAVWLDNGQTKIVAANPDSYRIYWSAAPDGFTDDNELPPFETETIVDNPLGNRRCYYHIFSDTRYSVVAPRILIGDRKANLRDIGGYNTQDMTAFVKHGVIYRSHALADLDEAAMALLETLGIDTIVDFRTEVEVEHKPDPPVPGTEYYNLSPMVIKNMNQFNVTMKDFEKMDAKIAQDAHADVRESYKTMVFDSAAYQKMFRLLADGHVPMLYHCTAGKDRTGIASALILWMVGVPRETIFDDYMLSNDAREKVIEHLTETMLGGQPANEEAVAMIRFFAGVELESIQSTFAAIDEKYDRMEDYFEQEMKLSANDIANIKKMLLVKHTID